MNREMHIQQAQGGASRRTVASRAFRPLRSLARQVAGAIGERRGRWENKEIRRSVGSLHRVPLLILFLVVSVLAAGFPPYGGRVAHASGPPYPPADLLNFSLLSSCNTQVSNGNPTIALYCATPDQIHSLRNLQQQAVSNTITDYHLDPGDANAVQSWGRNEALGELWALLTSAITTPACSTGKTPCRTTDQQNAVDWLTSMFQKQAVAAADDAGLEYVKWAGLEQSAYNSEVSQFNADVAANRSTTQDETNISNLLSGPVVNYNNTNTSQATGGYCVYRSPAPYQSEYTGYNDQTCFTPCTALLGCNLPTPTYDQFTKWGQADVSDQFFSSSDFVTNAFNIAYAVAGTAAAVSAVGALALSTAILVFLPATVETVALANTVTGLVIGEVVGSVSVGAATIAAVVAIVVAAIVIAVLQGINVANAAQLPGKLATLITKAPGNTPDLTAILNDSSQSQGLFNLFVGAALPSPRNASCDNSQITLAGGAGGIPAQCLNPTPIPAPTTTDPSFEIQAKTSTSTTNATSLTWKDAVSNVTNTARLHETWFIDQQTSSGGATSTVQELHMHYSDWSGKGQTAVIVNSPSKGYQFLTIPDASAASQTFDPATCLADKTCSEGSTIQYVGPDGNDYTASVTGSQLPQVAPTFDANPVEGSPVTFTANGSSPVGSSLTYQWTFEMPAGSSNCVVNCSAPTVSASGAVVTNTWTTSGTYHVTLTATDAQGRSTVYAFSVSVGDVPPTLSLAPACPTVLSSPCDVRSVAPGSATTLTGSITHAGSADTETLDIHWGDGTADDTTTVPQSGPTHICIGGCPTPNPNITQTSGTLDTFSGTHTYAKVGSYTVTVKVTDQAGGTETRTTTETVQYATQVAWTQPQPITYGTPLGASQLDAAASATAAASVPGSFTYSVDGTPVTASDNRVLSAGPHTLSVQFKPTDPTTYTTPAAFTVPLQVNQAPLTITAGSPSVVYTGTVPAITPSYSGFVNHESPDSLTTKPTCTSTAPSSGAVGSYSTSCSGAVDSNYAFSYVPGTMTITKAATSLNLGTSGNPLMQGNSVTFTATVAVTAPGAGTPTGTVTFKDGSTTLGTGRLSVVNGQDQATFTTSSLGLGAHTITASYGGDGNFTGTKTTPSVTQNIDTNLSRYPKLSSGAYNLSITNLSGGYFIGENLTGASLTRSNLINAVFTDANLTNANLSLDVFMNTDFTGANLTDANLSTSYLKGANFTNANLTGANFTGADLTGATGLKSATLTNVVWSNTTCPDGSNSSADGGTCVGHL